jgi:hypothetical protein
VLLVYRAGRYGITTLGDAIRYSSRALSTAVSTTVAIGQAAKTLSGPVAPPLPSLVHAARTYFSISSLRRDQYEVVFLLEGGHQVFGFKLTRQVQGNGSVDHYAEQAGYFVKREDGGTSELPRSAWPLAWRPQAYAE